jgi:sulfate adenylyltransferase
MRMAGPKEALWHAIINKNYGCSHMLIGPHHASPPVSTKLSEQQINEKFYAQNAAQELVSQHQDETGIQVIATEETRYVASKKTFLPLSVINEENLRSEMLTDHELKEHLHNNKSVPEWFSYPEVLKALSRAYPARCQQGFTLFFTGLSGSGKSTLAKIIYAKLVETGGHPVTRDGDVVRMHLSSELGFSKAHRNLNIKRIGFVASEISKNGGVAICAPIAPYAETRAIVRRRIEEQGGGFIEIHVATPVEVCEARDRKGLYAKARRGEIKEFTGISDPYEEPEQPELRIDTSELSASEASQDVFLYLLKEGYLA